MIKRLHYDPATRGYTVVYTDLFEGQHERYEYRVTDGRTGPALRTTDWASFDGREVKGHVPGLYIEGAHGQRIAVWTEEVPLTYSRTACPRERNRRRRCPLCDEAKG